MTDKKQTSCGCGCVPSAKTGPETPKQEDKEPKK